MKGLLVATTSSLLVLAGCDSATGGADASAAGDGADQALEAAPVTCVNGSSGSGDGGPYPACSRNWGECSDGVQRLVACTQPSPPAEECRCEESGAVTVSFVAEDGYCTAGTSDEERLEISNRECGWALSEESLLER